MHFAKKVTETEEFNFFLFNTNCNGHIPFCVCIYWVFLFVPPDYKLFQAGPGCLFHANYPIIQYCVHLNRGYTCYVNPLPSSLFSRYAPEQTIIKRVK